MPDVGSDRQDDYLLEDLTAEDKAAITSIQALFASNSEIEPLMVQSEIDKYPNGLLVGDLWGYITYVNQALVQMMGVSSASDLIGKHMLDFLPVGVRGAVAAKSLNCIATNTTQKGVYAIPAKNGKVLTLEASMDFMRDKCGQNIGFIDIIKNIKP